MKISKTIKYLAIILCSLFVVFILMMYIFLRSLAPQKITISTNSITTNGKLEYKVSIEKIKVDSIGKDNHPVKYTAYYSTICHIYEPTDEIYINKTGNYRWTEDYGTSGYIHKGLRRELDTNKLSIARPYPYKYNYCPIKFEKEQWYFITVSDKQITGYFFYIDKDGKENQYNLYTGISPI